MKIPTLLEMLQAGVHFGHQTSRWHPKMAPYIFGVRSGIHVIDIEQTQKQLESVLGYVSGLIARGETIVMVGTKKQLAPIVEKYAKAANVPYIHNRWLGGTFTNFEEIQKLIKNYLDLQDKRTKGELKKYTKLEQLQFDRKIDELDEKIGGISTLKKLPEAMFVFDVRNEKTAIAEARKRGIKVVAVCDTNVNPDLADYIIPANDDSVASLEMIAKLLMQSVQDGRNQKTAQIAEAAKKAEAAKLAKELEAAQKAEKAAKAAEDSEVTAESKETVEDLDDAVKDELAKESENKKRK